MHRHRGANPPRDDRAREAGRTRLRQWGRTFWVVGAATIALSLLFVAVIQTRRTLKAARLPPLPDLSAQPAALRSHLLERQTAARQDPFSEASVGALCFALHADMYLDDAERCYRLTESLKPSDWRWTYDRALILSERGGGETMIEAIQRVLAAAPDFGPAWLRLGEAEFKEGRYNLAKDAWTRAIAADEPERSTREPPIRAVEVTIAGYAALGLARIAFAQEHPDAAREILEPLARRSPRFGTAHRLLADSYDALGRREDADAARARADQLPAYAPYADPMLEALARESRNGTFLLRQASEADLAANGDWAEYLTRRALTFDPDNPDVLAKRGRVLRYLGRNEEALEVLAAYNQKVPGDFQGLAQTGSCLTDLGRLDEAEHYLRRALEGLDDGLTHYNLGVVLAATNRLDEAIAEYGRALDRDPRYVDARNNLAAALARQGKLREASRELARVLAIDPSNRTARENLDRLRGVRAGPSLTRNW